jgi:hypothetical protein
MMGLGLSWDKRIYFLEVPCLLQGRTRRFVLSFLRCLETYQALQGDCRKRGLQFAIVISKWWKIKFPQEILPSEV